MMPLMHDDATAILRSYTEEALSKSRKNNAKKGKGKKREKRNEGVKEESEHGVKEQDVPSITSGSTLLQELSEEELVRELARRRAERFRLAGAMPGNKGGDNYDPTGQVCTLNGGDWSIPCRELME
jgi:hypothetical protein